MPASVCLRYSIYFCFLLILIPGVQAQVTVRNLTCDHRENPMGIEVLSPRLSWQLASEAAGMHQAAYQIQVAGTPKALARGRDLVWNSGKVEAGESLFRPYEGPAIKDRTRYYWRVRVWDQNDQVSPWSEPAYWETGFSDSTQWKAKWIQPAWEEDLNTSQPCTHMRKPFTLNKKIQKARLYITAHGLYEAWINGKRVGDQEFTPGWTSYHNRLQYQVYDVTDHLAKGENVLGVTLGDGWYRGFLGFRDRRNTYGDKTALLCQLEVMYANGERVMTVSGGSWQASTGPVLVSDIYNGETYDARLEKNGWTQPGFKESWEPVQEAALPKSNLIASEGPPVRQIEELKPLSVITTPKGETVLDMGQNLVGWMRFRVSGNAGDSVILYHAEVLDKDGNFYIDNLRAAKQKMVYVLKGGGVESYEPHFTFMGFRYVKVAGWPGEAKPEDFTAVVIHSDMKPSGTFSCSHPLINQLQHNIRWGMKGNFLDVPTDCPQRDERLGWTGDAQAFAPTACFNMNTASFFTKWLKDLAADQMESGSVPWVIPDVLRRGGATGWADAATIIPWEVYQAYGDIRVLENQYESMTDWVEFMRKEAGGNFLWQSGFHFGDWLYYNEPTNPSAQPGYTDKDLLATAFFARSAWILAKTSELLGKEAEKAEYSRLYQDIKDAFEEEFITKSGRLSPNSQTAYVLALAHDLVPKNLKPIAARRLAEDIRNRKYHLSTGFLGTPHLARVLSENGYPDVAYELLTQETYPSWLYPVKMGATTIWERWDGIKPDSSFQNPGMNSFNHYAYGAIGHWMYTVTAGIQPDPESPGYRHFFFRPLPGGGLTSAEATHMSPYGEIRSAWELKGDMYHFSVTVPANTTATFVFPHGIESQLQPGSHSFEMKVEAYRPRRFTLTGFNRNSVLRELWRIAESRRVLLTHAPELEQVPEKEFRVHLGRRLTRVSRDLPDVLTPEVLDRIDADLKALVP